MHGKHLKILGLSLLALVGIIAVSASAAQAKWLLLLNGTSVLAQNFKFTVNTIEFLVPNLGVSFFCPSGGKGTDGTKLNETHTTQTGAVSVTLTGCKDLALGEVCTVHGVGEANGTITVSGSGGASMEGEKVLVDTESTKFASIEFLGEECPLTEISGIISGNVRFEILKPLEDAVTHEVKTVAQKVLCGSNPAVFHAGHPGQAAVAASIASITNEAAGIHLVGL